MKTNKYMRVLLCERDDLEEADLIEGPKEIIENIRMYRQPFYDYMEKNYYGDWEDYDWTEGFVSYLNEVALTNTNMRVKIVERNVMDELEYFQRVIL